MQQPAVPVECDRGAVVYGGQLKEFIAGRGLPRHRRLIVRGARQVVAAGHPRARGHLTEDQSIKTVVLLQCEGAATALFEVVDTAPNHKRLVGDRR